MCKLIKEKKIVKCIIDYLNLTDKFATCHITLFYYVLGILDNVSLKKGY